jgi:exodeoxyribonuclease V alpha subunit
MLLQKGVFSYIDLHFAEFMQKLDGRQDDVSLFLAAAAVSNSNRQGNICLELSLFAGRNLGFEIALSYPDLTDWIKTLSTSPVVGRPGEFKPLIFDGTSKLYLHRYSVYQTRLVSFIRSRVYSQEAISIPSLKKYLDQLFHSNQSKQEIDWQKIACIVSARNRFSVISGGPGTGKTTTIVKLMTLLLEMNPEKSLNIALAVPTGKAAARLQDAIRKAREQLLCGDDIKARIPSTVSTIHRLLGTIPDSPYFRYNEKNRLDVDVAIIDESSMVDLALLSKFTMALPEHARLILVGDKDQLASVEAGSVFGDICDACSSNSFSEDLSDIIFQTTGLKAENSTPTHGGNRIQDCMVQLRKSYRFGENSGIQQISSMINVGKGKLTQKYMDDRKYHDISWRQVPRQRDLQKELRDPTIRGFREYLSSGDPADVLEAFGKFRILCALREGPYGVHVVNKMIEEILASNGLIPKTDSLWYPGRPVMITRNDYNLNLFNGDVGIALIDPEDQELRIFFPDEAIMVRKIHPSKLGEHETVYAMTVHKSQGSEFEKILFLLPDRESPILTRELLYTAITRSRKKVAIWGDEIVFQNAVHKRVIRDSGLKDSLCIASSKK